jgi:hypothetical protein
MGRVGWDGDDCWTGREERYVGYEAIVMVEAKVIGMTRKRLVLERVNLKKRHDV